MYTRVTFTAYVNSVSDLDHDITWAPFTKTWVNSSTLGYSLNYVCLGRDQTTDRWPLSPRKFPLGQPSSPLQFSPQQFPTKRLPPPLTTPAYNSFRERVRIKERVSGIFGGCLLLAMTSLSIWIHCPILHAINIYRNSVIPSEGKELEGLVISGELFFACVGDVGWRRAGVDGKSSLKRGRGRIKGK